MQFDVNRLSKADFPIKFPNPSQYKNNKTGTHRAHLPRTTQMCTRSMKTEACTGKHLNSQSLLPTRIYPTTKPYYEGSGKEKTQTRLSSLLDSSQSTAQFPPHLFPLPTSVCSWQYLGRKVNLQEHARIE